MLGQGVREMGAPEDTYLEITLSSGGYHYHFPIVIIFKQQDMAGESQYHHYDIKARDHNTNRQHWESTQLKFMQF